MLDVYPTFSDFEFAVPFHSILSFLSATFDILDKDCNWAVSFIFKKKIVYHDRKMEEEEQGLQSNTNWLGK